MPSNKKKKKPATGKKKALPFKKGRPLKKTIAKKTSAAKSKQVQFTPRQHQMIRLICDQLNSPEIAEKTGLGKRTVEAYREDIMEKMKVKNVAGLVVYAIKHGLYKIR